MKHDIFAIYLLIAAPIYVGWSAALVKNVYIPQAKLWPRPRFGDFPARILVRTGSSMLVVLLAVREAFPAWHPMLVRRTIGIPAVTIMLFSVIWLYFVDRPRVGKIRSPGTRLPE